MKLHKNRLQPELEAHLASLLTVEGTDGLLNTATPLNDPFVYNGIRYDKAICIDFLGLAATTLFGRGLHDLTPYCFFDKLNDLAARAASLNEQGIIIKVRILLLYPYSSSGQARIQAEMNRVRSSISEPHFNRGEKFFMEQITEDSFKMSSLVTTVHHVITVIDEWRRDQLGPEHPFLKHPNRLDVRFSCLHPAGWGLRLNEHFIFDIYPMAKQDRFEKRCQNARLPLIEISLRDEPEAYKVYCDHFRYLWDHDATIDYRDAVHQNDMTRTLRLLPPHEVTFEHTAKRILGFRRKADDPETVFNFKQMAQTIFKRFCPPFLPWRAKEVVFLACSWRGNPPYPISEAEFLRKLLVRDFQDEKLPLASPQIEIRMVRASPGDELHSTINTALNDATIGVVFLSPEVLSSQKGGRDTFIARPNVYFELGHLMGRLSSQRILLFKEQTVEPLSNLAHLAHVKYEKGKVQLAYLELLVAFFERNLFPSRTTFEEIVRRHMQQLERDLTKGSISQEDYQWAQRCVSEKAKIKID